MISHHFLNRIEIKTELALMASEMRLLGFSDSGVARIQSQIINEKSLDAIWEMITKYKNMQDLYGDSQE